MSDPERVALLRKRLEILDDAPVIAAAGRLSATKGFDVLIRALNHLPVPRLTCVIAGSDAGQKEFLCQLAAQARQGISVSLPGRLNRAALADLFSLAAVVVVPSREEPFGLVALEALAMGRRLVASCTGGLAEFLYPPVAQLVPPDDIQALASAIAANLARGPLTTRELEEVGTLLSRYSWSSVAHQYQRLMAEALEGQG
jgi:glycosyltransferase involved in cell wall biosynthesis